MTDNFKQWSQEALILMSEANKSNKEEHAILMNTLQKFNKRMKNIYIISLVIAGSLLTIDLITIFLYHCLIYGAD